jgi:D-sedoheptulose 7-phosphate isomerase
LITAIANDISYEEVFAEPLRWYMKKGDMLVSISSSGNSSNVVRAVKMARSLGGIVITLSAMGENNETRKMGDLNFYISAQTYGLAESAHAVILHHWMDCIESTG